MQLTTDLRAYGFFLSADMGPDQRLRLVVRHFSFAAASHMGTFVTSAKRPLAKCRADIARTGSSRLTGCA